MRMYELTGRKELLDRILAIYRLYKIEGMTENYANFNLFRELIWTEPCGIIDSYMLATSIWEQTGDMAFLEDAHAIWYNGVERAQRPNGGFGCDTCVDDGFVGIYEHFYEAYWCCSMRGGEGLGAPMRRSFYEDDDNIMLPFYLDAVFQREAGDQEIIREKSYYPIEGKIELEILRGGGKLVYIQMFLPSWAQNTVVMVNGKPIDFQIDGGFAIIHVRLESGTKISLNFDVLLFSAPTQGNVHAGKNLSTIRHGVLVLGTENIPEQTIYTDEFTYLGAGKYAGAGIQLMPLNQSYLLTEQEVKSKKYRVLFSVN